MNKIILCISMMVSCVTLVNSAGAAELSQGTPEKKCSVKLGIEVRAWFPKISGQETRGSKLDFRDDLGHQGKEVTNVKLNMAENSKWRGNYESYTFSGYKTALTEHSFGGQEYLAGNGLQSEKKLTYWYVNYLPNYQKVNKTNLSWLFGLKGYKMNSKVRAANVDNLGTEESYHNVVPSLGAHYEMRRNRSTVYYAEFSGSSDFSKGYSYDAEIGFQHKFSPNAILSSGYRCLQIYAEKNSSDMKLNLYGPFVQFNCKL